MTEPTGPTQPSPRERAALSRELGDFLIELSIALNKHAMYPDGHPSLLPAADGVVQRLVPLLEQRATLSLGVAREQLVIEGVATDAKHPVLRDLAARLHRHHLGAVSFRPGVTSAEIHGVLSLVALEADLTADPLGLGPPERLAQWTHVRLYPMTYERLELVDETPEADQATSDEAQARTRAAQLWIGLARAALAGETVVGEGGETGTGAEAPSETDPAIVARAIDDHPRGTAYDQVIVGYLLQMADELRASGTGETIELRRRMSQLIGTLDPKTLERLLEMGGDRAQRRQFLLNASQGVTVQAVLDLVRAASASDAEQNISHSLLRMLQKLARHVESGTGPRRTEADEAIRDQVANLIRGWSLGDPNPGAYRVALDRMAAARPVFSAPDKHYRPDPRHMLEMALEADGMGQPVARAVDDIAAEGGLKWVLQTLEAAQASKTRDALWSYVATAQMIERAARAEPFEPELLDLLLPRVGLAAAKPMLDVLTDTESSQARRVLLDRLVGLGPRVGPLAVTRLSDERWFVVRNMLKIIGDLPELPPGFKPSAYVKHRDHRVRREAFRLLLRDPAERERALAAALTDSDERTVRMGLTAALDGCPPAVVPLVVTRAASAPTEELRTLAIRVLGASRHPGALEALLDIAAPRRTLFRTKPPAKSAEYVAALSALHGFAKDARARQALAAAARSRDPDIAKAATRRASERAE